MMNRYSRYISLAVGHCINDCTSGFILGSLFWANLDALTIGFYTFLYNLLAFGGQLLVAMWLETLFTAKQKLLFCFVLLLCAFLIATTIPLVAVILSGIASAIFHVTGGEEATGDDGEVVGIGIFAAPGILGLIFGGFLAFSHIDFRWIGAIICALYVIFVLFFYKNKTNTTTLLNTVATPITLERHDLLMCLVLTVMSLRSVVWDISQMIQTDNYQWLITLAIAAALGKIIGGFVSDKINIKYFLLGAIALSIAFFTFFRKSLIGFGLGVLLLQSTIPATFGLCLNQLKQRPAIASALTFGLSVFIAIALLQPAVAVFSNHIIFIIVLLLLMCGAIVLFFKKI
jgi:MFS transporter, FSR family, fosmidomycin resistance protein